MAESIILNGVDTAPAVEDSPEQDVRAEEPLADSLIEDISIDGMCGVY
jgi:mycofactocin precursor